MKLGKKIQKWHTSPLNCTDRICGMLLIKENYIKYSNWLLPQFLQISERKKHFWDGEEELLIMCVQSNCHRYCHAYSKLYLTRNIPLLLCVHPCNYEIISSFRTNLCIGHSTLHVTLHSILKLVTPDWWFNGGFFLFSMQSSGMEETVWEQYTVTLQRVCNSFTWTYSN